jgi:hypothetical protein
VKNQYIGDVDDYRKYEVLRCLSSFGECRSFVAWMLSPDDVSRDGRWLAHLEGPDRWRGHDPQLFDTARDGQNAHLTRETKECHEGRTHRPLRQQ